MNHRAWVLGAALLGVCGCAHGNWEYWSWAREKQTRLQAAEEGDKDAEAKREHHYDVKTIGDATTVGNAQAVAVSGVGLVVGLEGTGGDPPAGGFRIFLEHQLQQENVENVKEVLASPDTSLVLISGAIPPGAHKGDRFDVEVTLPPQSKTTSLRGGYLRKCFLFNYDTTKNLLPNYEGANRLLLGHPVAEAEGPLLVGFGDGDENAKLKTARMWGAGQAKISRPFYLIFNNDQQRAPVVQRAADRINETFRGPYHAIGGDLAVAKTKTYLVLGVPPQYKYNLPRYLRVVRLIPMEVPADQSPYRKMLQEDVLDPAHTVTAALRLEALGTDSIPALKAGLESPHPLVRFTCAEALAYLGSPACGEALADLAVHAPALRAFSLTAMASLDEAICHVKLRELLASPGAETRYGAFRALRALDERDPAVQGEHLNESFWLHRVAPDSTPLVHLATSQRAEIVLFGEEPVLVPPFSFLAGEFTVTAAKGDDRCTLCRLSVRHGTRRRQCSLKLQEVLHNLADMGAMYPEVVELLRQAGKYQCLNCPVAVDALPEGVSVYDLARDGVRHQDNLLTADDQEILRARDEFGATPTLYDRGSRKHRAGEGRSRDAAVD